MLSRAGLADVPTAEHSGVHESSRRVQMPESDASRSEFKLIPSESTALGEVLPIPAPRYEPTTEMDYRKIAPPLLYR